MRGLVPGAALEVEVDRVLERRAGRLRIRGDVQAPAGEQRGGTERRRAHLRCGSLELLHGALCRGPIAQREPRADAQLEPGDALEAIAPTHPAQVPLRLLGRSVRPPTVQVDRGPHKQRQPVRPRLAQQRARLVGTSLAATQLRQPHHAVDRLPGQTPEVAAGGRERPLRLVPLAPPDEEVRVVGAAGREHLRILVAARDLLDAKAPLARTVEVAHALARVDEMAADHLDDADVRDLARDGGGHRLVQPAHTVGHRAVRDERQPLDCAADHLVVQRAGGASGGDPLRRVRAGSTRIVLAVQRAVRAQVGEHGVLGHRRQAVQQFPGALQPSVHLGAAAELPAVEGQLDRQPRGRRVVAGVPREPVRALVGGERLRAIHLPAGRGSEALECLDGLVDRECGVEARPRLGPRRAQQRLPAGGDRVFDSCAHHTQAYVPAPRPTTILLCREQRLPLRRALQSSSTTAAS